MLTVASGATSSNSIECSMVSLDDGDYLYCPTTNSIYKQMNTVDDKKISDLKIKLRNLQQHSEDNKNTQTGTQDTSGGAARK